MRRCQEPGYYIVRNPGGCELGPHVSAAGNGTINAHALAVIKAIVGFGRHDVMISPRAGMVKGGHHGSVQGQQFGNAILLRRFIRLGGPALARPWSLFERECTMP